ncbi:pseudouridine synthase [Sporomusaceae bacterium FL31]|nr:pseudouridine synthase [Sporomusaceae bacterium FL31]GCE35640.1 pseudouridine synthase [Sporomusaceae bacterium]
MLKLVVPDTAQPQTVKDFLRRQSSLSLSAWRKLKTNGTLMINGDFVTINSTVVAGDKISLTWEDDCSITPTNIPLEIYYEDDYLLVINKPAGLLVHPTVKEHNHTLANGIMFYFRQHNLPFSFHPVHRLDRNTSGLILIAKLAHIQHLMTSSNIKNFKRIYLAVVDGLVIPSSGIISAPIGRHPDSIIERMIRPDGQAATTHYQTIASYDKASLVELELLTGRTHQIRVHMAHIGHPLLGDDLYGGSLEYFNRQALHASKLIFEHPILKTAIEIDSPLPDDMKLLLARL